MHKLAVTEPIQDFCSNKSHRTCRTTNDVLVLVKLELLFIEEAKAGENSLTRTALNLPTESSLVLVRT